MAHYTLRTRLISRAAYVDCRAELQRTRTTINQVEGDRLLRKPHSVTLLG